MTGARTKVSGLDAYQQIVKNRSILDYLVFQKGEKSLYHFFEGVRNLENTIHTSKTLGA